MQMFPARYFVDIVAYVRGLFPDLASSFAPNRPVTGRCASRVSTMASLGVRPGVHSEICDHVSPGECAVGVAPAARFAATFGLWFFALAVALHAGQADGQF